MIDIPVFKNPDIINHQEVMKTRIFKNKKNKKFYDKIYKCIVIKEMTISDTAVKVGKTKVQLVNFIRKNRIRTKNKETNKDKIIANRACKHGKDEWVSYSKYRCSCVDCRNDRKLREL